VLTNQGKWKYDISKLRRCSKSSSKREFCSDNGLHQKRRKLSNKRPNNRSQVTKGKKEKEKTQTKQNKNQAQS
jgi:hypothetical protein